MRVLLLTLLVVVPSLPVVGTAMARAWVASRPAVVLDVRSPDLRARLAARPLPWPIAEGQVPAGALLVALPDRLLDDGPEALPAGPGARHVGAEVERWVREERAIDAFGPLRPPIVRVHAVAAEARWPSGGDLRLPLVALPLYALGLGAVAVGRYSDARARALAAGPAEVALAQILTAVGVSGLLIASGELAWRAVRPADVTDLPLAGALAQHALALAWTAGGLGVGAWLAGRPRTFLGLAIAVFVAFLLAGPSVIPGAGWWALASGAPGAALRYAVELLAAGLLGFAALRQALARSDG